MKNKTVREGVTYWTPVFYLQVRVTQSTEGSAEPQEIKTLGVGDYFGEKALIRYKHFQDYCMLHVQIHKNDRFSVV